MALTAYRYELPLARPFRTSGRTWLSRQGVLLRLKHKDVTAWGEAAPLPGFSRETVAEVAAQTRELASGMMELFEEEVDLPGEAERALPGSNTHPADIPPPRGWKLGDTGEPFLTGVSRYPRVNRFLLEHRVPPALQFAIDTLWTDYHAQREGCSPGTLLFGRMPDAIPVNAVLSLGDDLEETLARAGKLAEGGFGTIKVKVGDEGGSGIALLKALRKRHPDLRLRADANRAWSPKQALEAFAALEDAELEYCEEPLANCTPASLEHLASRTKVPVALDESLTDPAFSVDLLPFVNFFILKPMVAGGLSNLFATKALADDHDIEIIVTSSLEGSTGRSMTALIAGGLGSRDFAHGLATASVLEKDFRSSPPGGEPPAVSPPRGPGLPPVDPDLLSTLSTERLEL
ncbi:MAG: o-succinylbenzoate synthase [Balneolaceae bacterium]|nr:o-succinylbenzoate synthase [Balneolaceae bacterium]